MWNGKTWNDMSITMFYFYFTEFDEHEQRKVEISPIRPFPWQNVFFRFENRREWWKAKRLKRLDLQAINADSLFQALSQYSSRKNIFGNKHEVFFLNLEDGYFGCQVNDSTEFLQLYELSKLCDGTQDCFMGSDELRKELKCTSKWISVVG